MKNLLLTILMVFFVWGNTSAQTFEISGKVVNSENEVIPFANILLLSSIDSTFVQGTSAGDDGFFKLEEVTPDLYLLQASYIGRGSKPLALDIRQNVKLGALIIPTAIESLDEVFVTARRPVVQRLADRLVFQVENTIVSQGSSWDILKGTPGVIINQEELQIRGQNATVYLNDRKVQLSGQEIRDLLEGLSGVNIKSVEVIPNPPARYEAESGPILNIVTSKNIVPGYKGSFNGSYTQSIFPKYSVGTSQYFKTEKLNLFANYTYNPRKDNLREQKGINFFDTDNSINSIWSTEEEGISRSDAHNINTSIDYDFDDYNAINITSNMIFNNNQERNRAIFTSIANSANQIDSTFTTSNTYNEDNTNLAFDFSYVHKLKKPGATLTLNTHYTRFEEESQQNILSNYSDSEGEFLRSFGFQTDALQDIDILTGQLDFASPLGNASIQSGIKYSNVDSQSNIDFSNFLGADDSVNEGLSDDFLYDEEIFAAYLSFVKSWEKFSMKLGVRGEYTNAEGTSLTLGETNNQDFFEPFPSVYFLYTLSDKHSFAFDYGRKVARPRYNDLNPFRYFSNENDFFEGNPSLVPNFSNNFNINYTLNSEYFFDFYYRDNGNFISRNLIFQDNEAQVLRESRQNVLASTSYGLDFTVSKSIANPWFLYAYMSIFHEDETFLAIESGNQEFTNEVNGFFVYLANYLTLSEDGTFSGEVTFSHMSNYLFGSYIQDPYTNLTLGLRKSLWDNKAVISITAEDLLGDVNSVLSSRYLNQDNFYFVQPETQFVRIGFTYNFGNFRLEDNQRGIDKKERDRLSKED
ncbi:outer membrane beta-barrel family protein [Croceitalea rosinachiae]|uniref:Outer membrane beta-barrel family protein n=1 Tax=Croceitalea rosinachiae TaxID=3075596 RepID=A0ABU3A8U3_9FLAO|nr:outer membrane beta-barrel family protein [Croceitalea sp. F388]MDT0606300.1 outer membrane beta-barrel family protein [Croceitalea sp. F388]